MGQGLQDCAAGGVDVYSAGDCFVVGDGYFVRNCAESVEVGANGFYLFIGRGVFFKVIFGVAVRFSRLGAFRELTFRLSGVIFATVRGVSGSGAVVVIGGAFAIVSRFVSSSRMSAIDLKPEPLFMKIHFAC